MGIHGKIFSLSITMHHEFYSIIIITNSGREVARNGIRSSLHSLSSPLISLTFLTSITSLSEFNAVLCEVVRGV